MKLKQAIESLGAASAMAIAGRFAEECNLAWTDEVMFVFLVIVDDPGRVPGNIGGKYDDEEAVIRKWLLKYQSGKDGRASQRMSNLPGTIADPVMEAIIGARINVLTAEELEKITFAHRLSMSAENILGSILEEYLALNLWSSGWHCAWGETVRSVDFVHEDGRLLQIKNRSNSENSSSSAIRCGTRIEKWFRIRADKVEYMWDGLNEICGTTHLSEKNFVQFVQDTLNRNPGCLAVEDGNPWLQSSGN